MFAIKRLFIHYSLFILAIAAFLTGCATGGAHFKRTVSASNTFENYQLIPEYNYYYSGHSAKPVAIIGLKKDFKLSSASWVPVTLDEKTLRTWIDRMIMQSGAEYNTEPNGAYIQDDQGNSIGIWYSVWELPQMSMMSDNEIAVSRPNMIFPYSNNNPGDDDRKIIKSGEQNDSVAPQRRN